MPPVTLALLISNVLVFLMQGVYGDLFVQAFALWPFGNAALSQQMGAPIPGFEPWQLLTYGFLHGSPTHLFFNMFAVWMFGSALERLWGSGPYATFFLVGIVGAGLAQQLVSAMSGTPYPTVGASGGVYAVLLGFGMMFPNRMVMLVIPPIPMKAKYLVLIFGAMELYLGIFGSGRGVAHFAHLGGMVTGFVMIQYWRGKLPWQPRRIWKDD